VSQEIYCIGFFLNILDILQQAYCYCSNFNFSISQNLKIFLCVICRAGSETAIGVGTRSDPILNARALSYEPHYVGMQGSARRDPAGLGPGTLLPANGTGEH
jgi:hypothetical protein